MVKPLQQRFASLFEHPYLGDWLTIQEWLGLALTTVDAYARALLDYVAFCHVHVIAHQTASREHIAAYVHDLATRPVNRGTASVRYASVSSPLK